MSAVPQPMWVVLGYVAVSRLVELSIATWNERRLVARGAVPAGKDGLGAIAVVHASLFLLLPLEWLAAPWPRLGSHTISAFSVAILSVAVRYWASLSLGPYYTKRVLRLPGAALVARGPYRWLRHPIYRAVWVETVAWPLAFGCFATAAWLAVANALVLRNRIRVEEKHLGLGGLGEATERRSP